MIKFEREEVVKYFENGLEAAKWLDNEWETDGQFGFLLQEVAETFGEWINNHFTAYDILVDSTDTTFSELYEEWIQGLAFDIEHNYLWYFTNEGVSK